MYACLHVNVTLNLLLDPHSIITLRMQNINKLLHPQSHDALPKAMILCHHGDAQSNMHILCHHGDVCITMVMHVFAQ